MFSDPRAVDIHYSESVKVQEAIEHRAELARMAGKSALKTEAQTELPSFNDPIVASLAYEFLPATEPGNNTLVDLSIIDTHVLSALTQLDSAEPDNKGFKKAVVCAIDSENVQPGDSKQLELVYNRLVPVLKPSPLSERADKPEIDESDGSRGTVWYRTEKPGVFLVLGMHKPEGQDSFQRDSISIARYVGQIEQPSA